MKANRKSVAGRDEAVSPVIAVILMVAITVVLAATLYIWLTSFGSGGNRVVNASFVARAVDVPSAAVAGADADDTDDAFEITYVKGSTDLEAADVVITIDGTVIQAVADKWATNGCAALTDFCSTVPGGTTGWTRGESIYLWKGTLGALADFSGTHLVKVTVQDQVVLDTTVELHDDGSS